MHFADGEFAVSYEESIRGAHVFLVQSTFPNSDNLMELLLMIDAAKRAPTLDGHVRTEKTNLVFPSVLNW